VRDSPSSTRIISDATEPQLRPHGRRRFPGRSGGDSRSPLRQASAVREHRMRRRRRVMGGQLPARELGRAARPRNRGCCDRVARAYTWPCRIRLRLLDDELAGSLRELQTQVPSAIAVLAYPHGSHDERVRAATIRAGYRAAFTTDTGRNGAGTDPYCLRRVSVKDWDGPLSLLWKTMTGELVPPTWDRWTRRLRRAPPRPLASVRALRSRRRQSRHRQWRSILARASVLYPQGSW
jgi:hypothetical protein